MSRCLPCILGLADAAWRAPARHAASRPLRGSQRDNVTYDVRTYRTGPGGALPGWAAELAEACGGYTFMTARVHDGDAVEARRAGDGTGPLVVITGSEEEMRAALGLTPRKPPP